MKPKDWPKADEITATDSPREAARKVAEDRMSERCWEYVQERGGLQAWVEGAPEENANNVVVLDIDSVYEVGIWDRGHQLWLLYHPSEITRHMRINTDE